MKKHLHFLLLAVCLLAAAPRVSAQIVVIPDPNFKIALIANGVDKNLDGDIQVSEAAVVMNLNVSYYSISDLTGIGAFTALPSLNCSNNLLTSLPALSNSLTYLDCKFNQLTSLPALPNSLYWLYCSDNQLTTLPALPNLLEGLVCRYNQLTSLPALPNSLIELDCRYNQLASLPALPNSLQTLSCSYDQLTSLPALPNSLGGLYCNNNQLTGLPTLPNSLDALDCSYNQLTSLPALPNSLMQLSCNNNSLVSLPALPNLLTSLDCRDNQLTSLPALPNSLYALDCSSNQLTSLSALPNSLTLLDCYNNQLTSLPALPNSLIELYCYNNQLTSVPALPNSLTYLYCSNNQLTSLPALPDSLYAIKCDSNQISCFPIFPAIISQWVVCTISGNPATCLPNYVNGMDAAALTLPLCKDNDPVNNPNNCPEAVGIQGYVYRDDMVNCQKDTSETVVGNIPIALYDANQVLITKTYSQSNGIYSFVQNTGIYTIKIDTAGQRFTILCPDSQVVTITSASSLASDVNFGITCKPGFDVGTQAIWTNGWVFPGQQHIAHVLAGDMSNWLAMKCSNGVSGQVKVTYAGPVTYINDTTWLLKPDSIIGNTLIYNVANFGTNTVLTDFASRFLTDTTAQAGDQVCITVEVTPKAGDNDTTNNLTTFCYSVFNSYDPNMKEVSPAALLPNSTDWLTYTIHFQNTGNAPAFNITLRDTLDANLNLETFQVMNYSHANKTTLFGNALTVKFPNIMLADSFSNEPASHGFIQYRIRPKANLPLGTQIPNRAGIYFDFNAPIITNTATTSFATSISREAQELPVRLAPNPTNGSTRLAVDAEVRNYSVQLTDLAGRTLIEMAQQSGSILLPTENLVAGTYFIRIQSEQGVAVRKLVKE